MSMTSQAWSLSTAPARRFQQLKAEVVRRMPGALIEIYSMTEGGVVCLLRADTNPKAPHRRHPLGWERGLYDR